MSGYFGTQIQQRLQAQAEASTAYINATPGACQAGRTMGCDDPDQLGWDRINAFLTRDGVCGFRLISAPKAEEIRSQLIKQDCRFDTWEVFTADRATALARMTAALSACQAVGLATNIGFLKRLIASAPFATADLDTGLIERHHAALFPPLNAASLPVLALACAAILQRERIAAAARSSGNPWAATSGWRMLGALTRAVVLSEAGHEHALRLAYAPHGFTLHGGEASVAVSTIPAADADAAGDTAAIALRLGHDIVRGSVVAEGELLHVFYRGEHAVLQYADPMAHAGVAEVAAGRLTAPMPGKVVAVLVAPGDTVEAGTPLMIMEAMKMEHTIAAPHAGVVDAILYVVGDQVADGAPLLSFAAPTPATGKADGVAPA